MKGFGWFCVILGCASFLGAAINGNSVFGPAFWLALGIYLVHRAKNRKEKLKISQNIWQFLLFVVYLLRIYNSIRL